MADEEASTAYLEEEGQLGGPTDEQHQAENDLAALEGEHQHGQHDEGSNTNDAAGPDEGVIGSYTERSQENTPREEEPQPHEHVEQESNIDAMPHHQPASRPASGRPSSGHATGAQAASVSHERPSVSGALLPEQSTHSSQHASRPVSARASPSPREQERHMQDLQGTSIAAQYDMQLDQQQGQQQQGQRQQHQQPQADPVSTSAAAPSALPMQRPGAGQYIATSLRAIDVEVPQGPGLPHRLLRVLLDYSQVDRKPYLGGFRNKRSGAVYHHACTQTPRAPKYAGVEPKLTRETQTVKLKQHSQQTRREYGTQMERPGLLADTTWDRVRTPGQYQTADERDAIVLRATMTIQRWTRGWMGRKRAAYLRRKKAEREAFLLAQELKAQDEADTQRRKEIERRMHPRTAGDFEILYNELEAWRLQETRKIKDAGLPLDQEQAVLQQLLNKETKLLQTIDRLKINANQENKDLRIQRTLREMSMPKKFELKNGGKVEVHTPFTTRAKELQQLYNGLNLPMLTVDERLDVLLHVKWTVKEFDCDLTREVVDLIDREADLLNRGRNPKVLDGLRKRISSLFLRFIETPEFNPEASRFQIVPMDFEQYLYQNVSKAMARPTLPRA